MTFHILKFHNPNRLSYFSEGFKPPTRISPQKATHFGGCEYQGNFNHSFVQLECYPSNQTFWWTPYHGGPSNPADLRAFDDSLSNQRIRCYLWRFCFVSEGLAAMPVFFSQLLVQVSPFPPHFRQPPRATLPFSVDRWGSIQESWPLQEEPWVFCTSWPSSPWTPRPNDRRATIQKLGARVVLGCSSWLVEGVLDVRYRGWFQRVLGKIWKMLSPGMILDDS